MQFGAYSNSLFAKMEATLPLTAKPQALKPFKSPLLGSSFPLSSVKCSFPVSGLSGKLRLFAGSCPALSVIRAQISQGYTPDAQFYKIEAILRPWRVTHVSSGLLKIGIRGVTVSDVRGFGAQGGSMERHGGSEFSEDSFVAKVKMEIVVSKDQMHRCNRLYQKINQIYQINKYQIQQEKFKVEEVVYKIIEEARTGEIGDGKIFLIPVSDVIRVRTGERGEKGERMMGGRADMISTATTN